MRTTTTTTTTTFSRSGAQMFERARHAHAPPTARRRRVAGAPAARDLGAAATPLARRPLAMSHRTGAPLERGGGGGSKVLFNNQVIRKPGEPGHRNIGSTRKEVMVLGGSIIACTPSSCVGMGTSIAVYCYRLFFEARRLDTVVSK